MVEAINAASQGLCKLAGVGTGNCSQESNSNISIEDTIVLTSKSDAYTPENTFLTHST